MEYRVVVQNIESAIFRDVGKAESELSRQIMSLIAEGWVPQGGLASVQAGGGVYLLQAMTRDRSR